MAVLGVDGDDIRKSYNYLRLGIVLAALMLLAAVAMEIAKAPGACLQNSFSAYYYTPVRAVFVGALVAIGLSLIVIKGKAWEDLFLNVAGFLAPVVAFVPTTNVGECYSNKPIPEPLVGTNDLAPWVEANVSNNMFALLAAGVIAGAAAAVMLYRSYKKMEADGTRTELSLQKLRFNWVGWAALVAIIAYGFFLFPPGELPDFATVDVVHDWAAILMFAFLAAAAVTSGLHNWATDSKPEDWLRRDRRFALVYWVIAAAMALTALVFLVPTDRRVLYVEALEILWFTVYWVLQTWDHSKDPPPSTEEIQRSNMIRHGSPSTDPGS